MLIDIFMKFHDNSLNSFQVIVPTQLRHNFMTESSKGNYSKGVNACVTVLALCMFPNVG